MAEHRRTVELAEPLLPGQGLTASSLNGGIKIRGDAREECRLTATIVTRAMSSDEAEKLSGKIHVTLERSGDNLIVRIEKPDDAADNHIRVSLAIAVPASAKVVLTANNGGVDLEDMAGRTQATAHNGTITAARISGPTQLRALNGSVHVDCRESTLAVCDMDIETSNGGMEFVSPSGLSATVEAIANNGMIILGRTSWTTEATAETCGTSWVRGKIGPGEGRLRLTAYNGSITIR